MSFIVRMPPRGTRRGKKRGRSKSTSKKYGSRGRMTRNSNRGRRGRRRQSRGNGNLSEITSFSGRTVGQLVSDLNNVVNQLGQLINNSSGALGTSLGQLGEQISGVTQATQPIRSSSNRFNPQYSQSQAA